MGNHITLRLKYKESVIKFSYKYGVTKAAIKFGECRRTIYRWRNRYDGTLESLKDQERFYYKRIFYSLEDLRNQGKQWKKEYNNFPMRPLGWLSPRDFIKKYKSQGESFITI